MIMIEYSKILEAIEEYNNMTSLEVQEQLKPIIKSYPKEFLANYLGLSESHLFRMCKKLYVDNGEKPLFHNYIKIISLGINPLSKKEYKKIYYKGIIKKIEKTQ